MEKNPVQHDEALERKLLLAHGPNRLRNRNQQEQPADTRFKIEDRYPAMDENSTWIARRLTIDFVMSVCALLISAVACATSLYQLRNASLIMFAQTWPYVTVGWHYDNDESGILATNDGQGPAIVHIMMLKLDGQPQHDTVSALQQIVSGTAGSIQVDALLHGSVIRPGQTLHLLTVRGAAWDKQLRAAKDRIDVEFCYCSILKQCWRNVLDELPQEIERCDETSSLVTPNLR